MNVQNCSRGVQISNWPVPASGLSHALLEGLHWRKGLPATLEVQKWSGVIRPGTGPRLADPTIQSCPGPVLAGQLGRLSRGALRRWRVRLGALARGRTAPVPLVPTSLPLPAGEVRLPLGGHPPAGRLRRVSPSPSAFRPPSDLAADAGDECWGRGVDYLWGVDSRRVLLPSIPPA